MFMRSKKTKQKNDIFLENAEIEIKRFFGDK